MLSWKVWSVAALTIAAQSTPVRAQLAPTGNGGAPRDPWRFTPSIGIDETYSDNINLQPAGSERSDLVTSISPAFRLTRFGPRLNVNFNYNPQLLYYARGSNGAQFRNSLDASANAAVIENFLFFDARAAISQGNVSPFGTLAGDSVNGSSNRAETRTYSLGPSLRSHFGSDLQYSAGYVFTGSTSNNDGYAGNHSSTLYGRFESGTSFRNLGYGFDASRNDQSAGNGGEIVQETVGTTLTYVVSPSVHLRGRLGYDRNSYPTTGQPDLKGPSYSGGFDYAPSRHTTLNVQVGHRYFGPTANVSLRETTPHFVVNGVYSRDQTTSAGSGLVTTVDPNYALLDAFYRATIADPALRQQAVTAALQQAGLSTSQFGTATFLSNQLYLQKTLQLSVATLGLRNTVSFDVVRQESQSLSNIRSDFDVFNQSRKFRVTTFTLGYSHKLGPQTSANFSASKNHSMALEGTGDTRQRQLSASVSRQFQRRLSGTLLYRNTAQSGNGFNAYNGINNPGGVNGGNYYSGSYRENALLGSLRLTF